MMFEHDQDLAENPIPHGWRQRSSELIPTNQYEKILISMVSMVDIVVLLLLPNIVLLTS